MTKRSSGRWDLFCRVVDNFGDIGVCWRLARILAGEHGISLRLIVDRPEIFVKISGDNIKSKKSKCYNEISVVQWHDSLRPSTDTVVVVEAFACDPPQQYVEAMANLPRCPLWINLEYLSAEAWVADCHGLVSRHPRFGLDKRLMIPGFDAASAGLQREASLYFERRRFLSDAAARGAMWRALGLPPPVAGELRASLFGYENAAVPALLNALSRQPRPITVLVPEGRSVADLAARLNAPLRRTGDAWRRGSLGLRVVPFTDQNAYDRLLWACDLNMVRGEDSLVRALWSGGAMLWQAYPQSDDAHHAKVEAVLGRLLPWVDQAAAGEVGALWLLWNGIPGPPPDWQRIAGTLDALSQAIDAWRRQLEAGPELAMSLVNAAEKALT